MYKKPNKHEQDASKICRIKVYYRSAGKYNILETLSFGYRLSVVSEIQPTLDDEGNMFITYDAYNASMMINDKGYIYLLIKNF